MKYFYMKILTRNFIHEPFFQLLLPFLLPVRWLVEDYATLCTLSRLPSPDAFLGVVTTKYTIQFSIVNFTRSQ